MSEDEQLRLGDENPSDEDLLIDRAIELHESGESEAAIHQLGEMLGREPNHFRARGTLANFLSDAGRYDEAIRMMRELEIEAPDDPYLQVNLGIVLRRIGQHQSALACFRKARDEDPDHLPFHLEVAEALLDLDQTQEAMAEYSQMLKLFPDSAEAWWTVGNLLGKQFHQNELAHEYLRRSHELDPSSARTLSDLAGAAFALNKFDDAERYALNALKIDPQDYIAMCNLGAVEEHRKRFGVALR